jgi:hypothetical protein
MLVGRARQTLAHADAAMAVLRDYRGGQEGRLRVGILSNGAGLQSTDHSLRCTLVHARIPIQEVRKFWAHVQELTRRFAQIPRAGDQVYGFAAGLYPTDAPTLPDAGHVRTS